MLFAPAELNPYDWWFIKSFNAWQKRYWQADYEAWAANLRSKSELLESYKRYREQMAKYQ
jgi:hypothetical protein